MATTSACSSSAPQPTSLYVQKPGRVFVGNVPKFATEEELSSACSVFGPVVSFKLIVDKDTGDHKGYGFCEFRDEETALSAIRNQKGLLCQGRQLRVNKAHSAQERAARKSTEQMKKAKEADADETPSTKTSPLEPELDVYALRQAMKLREQAAKCNSRKRGSTTSSEGSCSTVVAEAPEAKKRTDLATIRAAFEEDSGRQLGKRVPSAVLLEYASPAASTTAEAAAPAKKEDNMKLKELSSSAATAYRGWCDDTRQTDYDQQTAGISKPIGTGQINAANTSSSQEQQSDAVANLYALLHLLRKEIRGVSPAQHHSNSAQGAWSQHQHHPVTQHHCHTLAV